MHRSVSTSVNHPPVSMLATNTEYNSNIILDERGTGPYQTLLPLNIPYYCVCVSVLYMTMYILNCRVQSPPILRMI